MELNVLLLPLLGGYIFVSCWNVTRFDTKRLSGQRLLFHASVAGLVLLILSFALAHLLHAWNPRMYQWWRAWIPFSYAGTSLLAFVIGALGWIPLNRIFDKEKEAEKAVHAWGDYLEILLNRSMDETKQIAITLSNSKVYVGFVTSSFDPSFDRKSMMLFPTLSGYRDQQTKEMEITNDYAQVYEQHLDEDDDDWFDMSDEFQLVILVSEIISANIFDPDVYRTFESLN